MVDPDMQGLVVDIGRGFTKAGFSGDDAPRAVFPTIVGRPKNPNIMIGMDAKDCFVGDEAKAKQGILNNKHPVPICRGEKYNFNDLEKMYHHTFYNELKVTPEEHPCIYTSFQFFDKNDHWKMATIYFETFNNPAVTVCDSEVLSLYTSGRTTGQVLEIGDGKTSTVSIFEGSAIQNTRIVLEDRSDPNNKRISGELISDLFRDVLQQNKRLDFTENLSRNQEIAERMRRLYMYFYIPPELKKTIPKHLLIWEEEVKPELPTKQTYRRGRYSYYTEADETYYEKYYAKEYEREYQRDLKKYHNEIQCSDERGKIIKYEHYNQYYYQLPDGKNIIETEFKLGDERFDPPEIIFRPTLIGQNLSGAQHMVVTSIKSCPKELQEEMYKNLVLSGGITKMGNFPGRFHLEMMPVIPKQFEKKMKIISPRERAFSAWIGGSILSSLSNFLNHWVTKDEYDEYGPDILLRKCHHLTSLDNSHNQPSLAVSTIFNDLDKKERFEYILEEILIIEVDEEMGAQSFHISCVNMKLKIRFKSVLLL